jgi:hypothetical protein
MDDIYFPTYKHRAYQMRHKLLKKISGIFGYKLICKNVVKNDRSLANYNLNLPQILEHLTKNECIKSVIQIGANDGSKFDDLNIL